MNSSSSETPPNLPEEVATCFAFFESLSSSEQVSFVQQLLMRMTFHQHGKVDQVLRPLLMRDFIRDLSEYGLTHVVERIFLYLDTNSLRAAEQVSQHWALAMDHALVWKRLIERQIRSYPVWRAIVRTLRLEHCFSTYHESQCRQAVSNGNGVGGLTNPLMSRFPISTAKDLKALGMVLQSAEFYRELYPAVEELVQRVERNWREGLYTLTSIACQSEGNKSVYCIQYDEEKIICGLRDNTMKVWDARSLTCVAILRGHLGSVLCLQYDHNVIISGSSDATIRVWRVGGDWACVNVIQHHSDAVLHLKFAQGVLVTCSKDRSIAVWSLQSPTDINLLQVHVGHTAAVNAVDFDGKYIVSASGDRLIKVWNLHENTLVRTLKGHKRGIACLQYRDGIILSGSSDCTIRIWDAETGHCLRTLDGHKELVRCIRFDSRFLVSGAYDGEIRIWDMQAALQGQTKGLCLQSFTKHTGRVFRLQFDAMKIVSSSHDDSIFIWDFCPPKEDVDQVAAKLKERFPQVMGSLPPHLADRSSVSGMSWSDLSGRQSSSVANIPSHSHSVPTADWSPKSAS